MSRWSEEEIQILREVYPKEGVRGVLRELKKRGYERSYFSVVKKASALGVRNDFQGMGRKWTEEEVRFLIENYPRMTIRELAKCLGRSYYGTAMKLTELRRRGLIQEKKRAVVPVDFSLEVELESILQYQEISFSRRVYEVDVDLGEYPVGIVFIGDLHIGHVGTDYKRIVEDVNTILDTPNLYVCLVGDYCEFSKSRRRKTLHEDIIPANRQLAYLFSYLNRLRDGLLGVVLGTHENFILHNSGIDVLEEWCVQNGVPYFRYGGVLNVRVGEVSYRICMRHEYRYDYSRNITNAIRSMYEMYEEFDIGVLAHRHQSAVQEIDYRGKSVGMVRCGTYKVLEDSYAEYRGHRIDSDVYMPMTILHSREKKFYLFRDFREGIGYLGYLLQEIGSGEDV